MKRTLRLWRSLPAAVLSSLLVLSVTTGAADGAVLPAPISSDLFGMHVYDPASNWPEIPFSSIRLHDTGTSWREMQPEPGAWRFETLDARVERAISGRREILMVLGQTPLWAAKRPDESSYNGPGAASEPADMLAWRSYVRTLAIRYKGRIRKWELWNEPNVRGFFTGTPETMLIMAREAHRVLKRIDPENVVLAPGIAVRTLNSPLWLDRYLQAGGGRYSDVIAVHLYVLSRQRPESILGSVSRIRTIMAKHRLSRPIWNTESAYGRTAASVETSELYTGQMAMAYVARTYILSAHARVARSYWYAWDDHGFGGLRLTSEDRRTPSDAGAAYAVTYKWLVRARLLRCSLTSTGLRAGTYTCLLTRGRNRMEISWHPTRSYLAPVPAGYQSVSRLDGSTVATMAGTLIRVSPMPIMVSTAPEGVLHIDAVQAAPAPPSFRCCGVAITAVGPDEAVSQVLARVGSPAAVHLCNAYTLSLAMRDDAYRSLVDSGDLKFADGFPVAAVGRRRGHAGMTARVYGPDLFLDVLRAGVDRGVRHYLYGATDDVLAKMVSRLEGRVPGVSIVGSEAPPFRQLTEEEESAVVSAVRNARADIVWVGLGTPKQDEFVARMRDRIGVPLIAVGAAFDFFAGTKPMAPAWMQRSGLEWAFRLATEPRRLWKRYLVGNSLFVYGVARDELALRRTLDGRGA